jgi:WD40 repeat protein
VNSVAIAPSGKLLAAGGNDHHARLWEPVTAKLEATLVPPHNGALTEVMFGPDAVLLFCRTPAEAKLWDVRERKVRITYPAGMVAYDPRGRLFAAWGNNLKMHLWDAGTRAPLGVLEGEVKGVSILAIAPEGRTLACVDGDGVVRLWDLPAPVQSIVQGGRPRTLPPGGVKSLPVLAFGPEDHTLATADEANFVHLWKLTEKPPAQLAQFKVAGSRITALALTADGRYLAAATGDGQVQVWDRGSLKEAYSWKMRTGVNGLAFASDSRHLATANVDGSVYLLRLGLPLPIKKGA